MNAFRFEWMKLWRPRMVVGAVGLMVAFCVFAASIFFLNASKDVTEETPQPDGPPKFPFRMLEEPDAPVGSISHFAGGFIVVVALVVGAQTMGVEYGWGTIRPLLAREPRRWRVLAGKLLALGAFLGVGLVASFLIEIGVATGLGFARGADMSAWWSVEGFSAASGAFLRVWFTASVWAALGVALAIAFRSAAPAVGVGIGYTFVVENLFVFLWDGADRWLPGQLLGAFNAGGTAQASLPWAGLLLATYATAFVAAAGCWFARRDITN